MALLGLMLIGILPGGSRAQEALAATQVPAAEEQGEQNRNPLLGAL